MCFTCSVNELGEGWTVDEPDRSVAHPHLRLISSSEEARFRNEGEATIVPFAEEFRRIPLSNLRDPELPIRGKYDERDLFELGDSMVHDGMIYPVIVETVSENFFEVIIGSRRVRAAKMRELVDIPALIVSPQSPLMKILIALAENTHRLNLDPFEEGKVFLRLMREYAFNTTQVAEKVRRPEQYVKERLQLLSLPDDVQQLVADGELAIRNAAALARLPEKERQTRLAKASVANRLAPNELRRKVASEIGEMRETSRVIPYRVTPEKFAARTEEFSLWFQRATPCLVVDDITTEDRVLMMGALAGLENQLGKMKELVKKGRTRRKKK